MRGAERGEEEGRVQERREAWRSCVRERVVGEWRRTEKSEWKREAEKERKRGEERRREERRGEERRREERKKGGEERRGVKDPLTDCRPGLNLLQLVLGDMCMPTKRVVVA